MSAAPNNLSDFYRTFVGCIPIYMANVESKKDAVSISNYLGYNLL